MLELCNYPMTPPVRLSVRRRRSVIISFKGGKFQFYAPIEEFVFIFSVLKTTAEELRIVLKRKSNYQFLNFSLNSLPTNYVIIEMTMIDNICTYS